MNTPMHPTLQKLLDQNTGSSPTLDAAVSEIFRALGVPENSAEKQYVKLVLKDYFAQKFSLAVLKDGKSGGAIEKLFVELFKA